MTHPVPTFSRAPRIPAVPITIVLTAAVYAVLGYVLSGKPPASAVHTPCNGMGGVPRREQLPRKYWPNW